MPLTQTILLGIDHIPFRHILADYVKEMNKNRFEILSKLKIFQGWDRAKLGGLLNHIYIRSPLRSSYIYEAGQKDENIYVVVSGECEIMATIKEKTNELKLENGFSSEEIHNYEVKSKTEKFIMKHKKVKEFSLLKVNEGNYFGDECGFDRQIKSYSVKVNSNNCKLFLIPKLVKKIFKLKIRN